MLEENLFKKKTTSKMFENLQDTCLLYNALSSITKQMNPPQESGPNSPPALEDNHEAADMVPSSDTASETLKEPEKELSEMEGAKLVASLVSALARKHIKNPLSHEEVLEKQFHINRRCHATMLYVALKSNGITCKEATFYFESIDSVFPPISWKFYFMLCFHCEWSEYFIESAMQLESDILDIVVNNILKIEWTEEPLKYYSWHMVLQVIIWKFFIIEDPSLFDFPNSFSFSYPFTDANSVPETENQELTDNISQNPLSNTFKVFLNSLSSFSVSCRVNFYYNKIILHAYKTIFKLLRKLKTSEKNVVRELFLLNTLLKQCCFEKESKGVIKSYKKGEMVSLMHYYSNASWKITEDYLLFILCSYWNDTLKILSDVDTAPCASLAEHFPSNEEKSRLISICSFYADEFEEDDGYDVNYLKSIIIYNYPCATNAAVVILHHPKIREKEEILQILESKASELKPMIIYQELIDVIAETESKETRIRFVKLLHLILSQATCAYSVSIYNDALKYMCQKHDMNDHFKLENFDDQLAAFSRKIMSLKEAEKCLLPLFIQSPTIVLKTLIEQILRCGSEGMHMIQFLTLVPMACVYRNALVTELEYYFSKEKLELYEEKNILKFFESLIDIEGVESLLNLNEFFQKCFIENDFKKMSRLHVNYDCLIVALKVLTNKNALKISMKVYRCLIDKICSIISTNIQLANGKTKAVAIAMLPLLEKYQEHGKIKDAHELGLDFGSNPFSTILHVYASQLYENRSYKDIPGASEELCDSLWIWCCHFKDATQFQNIILKKTIPYNSLLEVIITVLPHLTKEEWLESTHLIEEYFKYVDPASVPWDMPWLLSETDHQLYSVIRCLMDCYIPVVAKVQYYTTACFTNTVMNLLKEKASPELYLNIFLDTCHLISVTNTLTLHVSYISNIKKQIEEKTIKNKLFNQFYNRIMYYGVKNLPDHKEKDYILQHFD